MVEKRMDEMDEENIIKDDVVERMWRSWKQIFETRRS